MSIFLKQHTLPQNIPKSPNRNVKTDIYISTTRPSNQIPPPPSLTSTRSVRHLYKKKKKNI